MWGDHPASQFVLLKAFLSDYELGDPRRQANLRILFKVKGNMEKAFFLSCLENKAQTVAQENASEPCYFAAREDKKDLIKHCFLRWGQSALRDP